MPIPVAAGKTWLSFGLWPTLAATLLLALVAAALNYYRLPLFFGIDFIFGSSIAILALVLLGGKAALVIGCAGAAVTFLIWGHPYAWFVFTLEILWLAWRLQQDKSANLVLLDLQFWLFLGLPLIILFYAMALDASWHTAALIGLKQMSNAVFNTLLASVALLLLQLHHGFAARYSLPQVQLRQLIFHVMMTLTLLAGSVPLLLDTRNLQQEYQAGIAQQLAQLAATVEKQLQLQATAADVFAAANQLDKLLQALLPAGNFGLVLINEQGQIRNAVGVIERFRPSSQPVPGLGFSHHLPTDITLRLQRWRQSRYTLLQPVSGVEGVLFIGIERPATDIVSKLEQDSSRKLMWFFAFILLAIAVSALLSKAISRPLRKLDAASKQIKDNVAAGVSTRIPASSVLEYNSIAQTLMAMSDELTAAFTLSKANQSDLGRQVSEHSAQLLQTNSQLEAILAAASDFSIIATKPDGIITFFSRGAEKLTGYQAAELVNRQSPAILHLPSEVQQRAEQLTKELQQPISGFQAFVVMAEQKGSESREWHYVRKDGQTVLVQLTVTPIFDASSIINGYLGIAKDISERHRNEKLKNEFISTVSHELRTPLTSIYGALRMVNSGLLVELPPKVVKLLQVAEANSQRLTVLINDLLDMEKLLAGKMQLNMQIQPLAPLVQEALQAIDSYAEQYQVTLTADLAIMPLFANVDAARFIQILHNLLSNAIKFSAKASTVVVRLYLQSEQLKVEVRDQGAGIADEFKARIFERFSQSDAASTRQHGGTGLGLAISKELVVQMGGDIGFESTLGQGSTFWLTLPQAAMEQQS
ncbi:hypothetical protein WG68_00865 [Arsukibacterium ikkense]|uniref:histidine kinase n=1 Tax=Arsukibacterium ikkense TaxID=336831 RepID=A0A0M2VDM8_9GAMM|nr:HAMP domain-containing histidine kinase [Arsukibacterium ikkense]KKO47233.1 hypothetical protein WG68_00865 [Arsukibacterium ikkense]